MKYFTEEPHGNFTEDCLQFTVRGKIAMGLRVKYFMNFILFPVAIVTYVFYGLVLT